MVLATGKYTEAYSCHYAIFNLSKYFTSTDPNHLGLTAFLRGLRASAVRVGLTPDTQLNP